MAVNTVSDLAVFDKGKELQFIEENGEILFTAEEVGRHLGYGNPAEAINRLYQRNKSELKHYAVSVKLTGTDGKSYERRAFSEEGVYILSMLARTNEAKKFRARVALLLRRLRRERAAQALELARQAGYAQGLDEARALPAAKLERQAAYLSGMKEGKRLAERRDGLRLVTRAKGYLEKGLTKADAARCLGISRQYLRKLLLRATALGV